MTRDSRKAINIHIYVSTDRLPVLINSLKEKSSAFTEIVHCNAKKSVIAYRRIIYKIV